MPSLKCIRNRCIVLRVSFFDWGTLYRVAQKIWNNFLLYALTLPNINQFSKLFHCQNQEKICDNNSTKDPTTPQMCLYTTLWNVSVLKATIENKTTSVITYFKKLKTGNNVFIVSVIVLSNCHILQAEGFTSNVQCVLLAAGRRTQADDATDQWPDHWKSVNLWWG